MTNQPEVTSCKMCSEKFGIKYVPVEDYYNYECNVIRRITPRRGLFGWLRSVFS